jgi:uncharacterized protein YjiS (DUF1127 family)
MTVTYLPEPSGSRSLNQPSFAGEFATLVRVGSWLRRIVAAVGNAFHRAMMASRYRHAARQLGTLDDRMLRDLGINRSEINSVVRFGRFDGTGRF